MQYVTRYSRKSLRVLGSVGEPINPSAWRFRALFTLNLSHFKVKIFKNYMMYSYSLALQVVFQCCWRLEVPNIRHLVANRDWWLHGSYVFSLYCCSIAFMTSAIITWIIGSSLLHIADYSVTRCLATKTWFSYFPFLWGSGTFHKLIFLLDFLPLRHFILSSLLFIAN